MRKTEVISEIAKTTGVSKTVAANVVEAFMESVRNSMALGENVYLRGFGSFIVKERAEKPARNISKNTIIIVPSHFVPAFKPAKEFVAKVKGGK